MQQFFGLVNTLLATTPAAAARRLGMGTYRVVPLSPAAGEFRERERAVWWGECEGGGGSSRPTTGWARPPLQRSPRPDQQTHANKHAKLRHRATKSPQQ